jgi:ribosomal protein S18 acetylase RimI-like enzyme
LCGIRDDDAVDAVRISDRPVPLSFRPLDPSDQKQLWHWLHVALWDPPPAGLRPRSVLDNPHVRIYADDWGKPTDVGVVAVVDGVDAGACWMRLLPEGVGMGSIDAVTPQLGIALEAEYRGKGYGKALMQAALQAAWKHGYPRVSLTVHPENPAIALYEACGFRKTALRSTYHLMVAERDKG